MQQKGDSVYAATQSLLCWESALSYFMYFELSS